MVEAWFAILSFMLIGYAVLDASNIGSGVVQFMVARTSQERRVLVSAIGPLWTWHEVWLVAAGGVLFVAFPSILAVALPGFYLAVFVLLWCLVGRGLSIEFGGHLDDPLWRIFWDVAFTVVNLLIALLLGAALGNLLRGVPLGPSGKFSLAFFTDFRTVGEVGILDWYSMATALFTVACVSAHGASYLAWKTEGPISKASLALSRPLWLSVFILLPAITLATNTVRPELFGAMIHRPLAWAGVLAALGGASAIVFGQRTGRELMAFLGGASFMAGLLGAAAASVFPEMLHSTIESGHSMTAYTGAAEPYALRLALSWWPIAMALSLFYFIVVFRQFHGKVRMTTPPVSH